MSALATVSSRVVQALRQSSHPVLRNLAVEETDSTVVLTGRVSSYYLKQLAQETVMPVTGTRTLVNRVLVERV
jgi:osmotically-inducible protein OsmY